jgi:integrase
MSDRTSFPEQAQPEKRVPTYRLHRQSGQGIVTLTDGIGGRRDILLGRYGTRASRAEYARVIAEWEAAGRSLPQAAATADLTVNELILAFWKYATSHYRRPDGTHTSEIAEYQRSFRPLKRLYGHTPAREFGPLALKAVRGAMMNGSWLSSDERERRAKESRRLDCCRGVVNQRVGRVRRMFKWAVENELVPSSVLHGLQAVRGLQRGRSEARETEPVQPVSRAVVDDTLPLLRLTVADMVSLQLATGMRSGELVTMRACDLDTAGKVWLYRPATHKNAHHGHHRVIPIGPRGQEIIRRHLKADTQAFIFSPADSMAEFRARQRSDRKSKVPPSQQDRRKRTPLRRPGNRYTPTAYSRAIADAIKRYNRDRPEKEQIPHWHPHQLRHTRATELRREFGLDLARAVLGHRTPAITEVYAEIDTAKAIEAMARIG